MMSSIKKHRTLKKVICTVIAVAFLLTSLTPASAARAGNYGDKSAFTMIALGSISGYMAQGTGDSITQTALVNMCGLYFYYNYYNTYGKPIWSFKIGDTEITITRGMLYTMIASMAVNALASSVAGAVKSLTWAQIKAMIKAFLKDILKNIIKAILKLIKFLLWDLPKAILYAVGKMIWDTLVFIWELPGKILKAIGEIAEFFQQLFSKDFKQALEKLKNLLTRGGEGARDAVKKIQEGRSGFDKDYMAYGAKGQVGNILTRLICVDLPTGIVKLVVYETVGQYLHKKYGWDETIAYTLAGGVSNFVGSGVQASLTNSAELPDYSQKKTEAGDKKVEVVELQQKSADGEKKQPQAETGAGKEATGFEKQQATTGAAKETTSSQTGTGKDSKGATAQQMISSSGNEMTAKQKTEQEFSAAIKDSQQEPPSDFETFLMPALVKAGVLSALGYHTYKGSNNRKSYDNAIKMAIANGASGWADPRGGSFAYNVGTTASEVAWLYFCRNNNIHSSAATELMHLAATSVARWALSYGETDNEKKSWSFKQSLDQAAADAYSLETTERRVQSMARGSSTIMTDASIMQSTLNEQANRQIGGLAVHYFPDSSKVVFISSPSQIESKYEGYLKSFNESGQVGPPIPKEIFTKEWRDYEKRLNDLSPGHTPTYEQNIEAFTKSGLPVPPPSEKEHRSWVKQSIEQGNLEDRVRQQGKTLPYSQYVEAYNKSGLSGPPMTEAEYDQVTRVIGGNRKQETKTQTSETKTELINPEQKGVASKAKAEPNPLTPGVPQDNAKDKAINEGLNRQAQALADEKASVAPPGDGKQQTTEPVNQEQKGQSKTSEHKPRLARNAGEAWGIIKDDLSDGWDYFKAQLGRAPEKEVKTPPAQTKEANEQKGVGSKANAEPNPLTPGVAQDSLKDTALNKGMESELGKRFGDNTPKVTGGNQKQEVKTQTDEIKVELKKASGEQPAIKETPKAAVAPQAELRPPTLEESMNKNSRDLDTAMGLEDKLPPENRKTIPSLERKAGPMPEIPNDSEALRKQADEQAGGISEEAAKQLEPPPVTAKLAGEDGPLMQPEFKPSLAQIEPPQLDLDKESASAPKEIAQEQVDNKRLPPKEIVKKKSDEFSDKLIAGKGGTFTPEERKDLHLTLLQERVRDASRGNEEEAQKRYEEAKPKIENAERRVAELDKQIDAIDKQQNQALKNKDTTLYFSLNERKNSLAEKRSMANSVIDNALDQKITLTPQEKRESDIAEAQMAARASFGGNAAYDKVERVKKGYSGDRAVILVKDADSVVAALEKEREMGVPIRIERQNVIDKTLSRLIDGGERIVVVNDSPDPERMEAQQALANAGYFNGQVDGRTKPSSDDVIAFQKANNLKADGIIGPKTMEKMRTYLTKPKNQDVQKPSAPAPAPEKD